jgi:beta-alanine degradation protein BauB
MNKSRLLLSFLAIAFSLPAQEVSHVILENEFVKVLDIQAQALSAAAAPPRSITIAMSDGPQAKFGEVKWEQPIPAQHVIRIDLKKSAPPTGSSTPDPLDALIVSKNTQRLLFENAYVRAIEDRGPAGAITPKHTHKRGLLITMSAYDSEVETFPDGRITHTHAKAGDAVWSEPITHRVKNTGSTPTWAIRIEVK